MTARPGAAPREEDGGWRELAPRGGELGCHRRVTAIVTLSAGLAPAPTTLGVACRAKLGWGLAVVGSRGAGDRAGGDNVPFEAGAADGDKWPSCFQPWQAAGRQRAEYLLCATAGGWGDGRLGVAVATQGLARPSRGAGQCPAATPHPSQRQLSPLSLFSPHQASDTGPGPRRCHKARGWRGSLWKRRRLQGAAQDELIPCRSSIGAPAPHHQLPLCPRQPRRGERRLAESGLSKSRGDAQGGVVGCLGGWL